MFTLKTIIKNNKVLFLKFSKTELIYLINEGLEICILMKGIRSTDKHMI